MAKLGVCLAGCAGLGASAMGQMAESRLGGAGMVRGMFADEPGAVEIGPAGPVIASLSYDGSSVYGFAGQDFESVFDLYDTYCCEFFSIANAAQLGEFHTGGFGNGNPFAATDVIAEIYPIALLEDLCDDGKLPEPMLRTVPGVGFYDGTNSVSDFGGQCLPAGAYILRWAVVLDFSSSGQIYHYEQRGEHDNGGGEPNDGFQSNPGNAFGMGFCFSVGGGGPPASGINFVLFGDAGQCDAPCPDPDGCGDWDGDADSDGDDFFAYLDAFTGDDPCADLDENGTIDSDDFFAFLDRFVNGC